MNLRLVEVEMYLSQFDLDVRHKSERNHVISDALSRLSSFDDFEAINDEKSAKNQDDNILDDIEIYAETLMKMFTTFKNRLIQIYRIDKE